MTFPCPISDSEDISTGIAAHTVWLPSTPSPLPNPLPSWEVPIPMMWTPGALTHQLTNSVYYQGIVPIPKFIVQEGHNCGMMIMDITPPQPANQYYVINWPFSKREITFSASTVKMNGKAVGCTFSSPLLPMLTCGDPFSLPMSNNITNGLKSVYVGMTFKDFIFGAIRIGASMAIDAVFNMTSSRAKMDRAVKEVSGKAAENTGKVFLRDVAGKFGLTPKTFFKNMVSDATGFCIGRAAGEDPGRMAHIGHAILGAEYNVNEGGFRVTGSLFDQE